MEELITTFHVDWKMLIAQVINFGIVFLILYMFGLRPLVKMMKERSSKIEKGLSDASENAKLLADTEEKTGVILRNAKSESSQIISEAKKTALDEKSKIADQAKEEASKILESGKQELLVEQNKIITGTRDELASLVEQSTKKVLGESINIDIDKKLIETALKEFEKDLKKA